jgi:hypothetical protein
MKRKRELPFLFPQTVKLFCISKNASRKCQQRFYQSKDRIHSDANEAERQHDKPDDRIENEDEKGEGPADDQKYEPR